MSSRGEARGEIALEAPAIGRMASTRGHTSLDAGVVVYRLFCAMAPTGSPPATSATLPEPGDRDVVYLLDLSSYVFRAYHAIRPLTSSTGEPTNAVMGTMAMLDKVLAERQPRRFAVVMDSRTKTFRKEIDPAYKATRPPAPEDLKQQMTRCDELVRAHGLPVLQRDGFEADDLIAAAVRHAMERKWRAVIISSDKDLMQLIHDDDARVLLWDTMRDRVIGPREVEEKFGVRPSQVRDYLSLVGDSSDNIPGVAGVGPKTARELLVQYESLDALLENASSIERAKLREKIEANRDAALRSRALVTLRDDIGLGDADPELARGPLEVERLRSMYESLDLRRLAAALPDSEAGASAKTADEPLPKSADDRLIVDTKSAKTLSANIAKADRIGLSCVTFPAEPRGSHAVGFAVALNGYAFYVPIGHRELGAERADDQVIALILRALAAKPDFCIAAHDAKPFRIAADARGVGLPAIFDVLLASYVLDPEAPRTSIDVAKRVAGISLAQLAPPEGAKRGMKTSLDMWPVGDAMRVACAHARAMLELAPKLEAELVAAELDELFRTIETPLTAVLAHMQEIGILVDEEMLAKLSERASKELERLEAEAHRAAGRAFSLRSRDQLEGILFDELELRVVKKTPKGGRSTDASVLEELSHEHELPKIILEYREIDKLRGTYLEALPRYIHPETRRIHTQFAQAVAATGRLASSDPNLQNIPIRTPLGRQIREAFVPKKGCVILSADYSQIELRVLAHLSGDETLIEAFRTGGDIHELTASLIFGVGRGDVSGEMRRRAKTINFGVIYGMGEFALSRQLGITRAEAKAFIDAYFERYPAVLGFMERTIDEAKRGRGACTLFGRRRFLPNLQSKNRVLRAEAERVAKNSPIQGTAADILKIAMVRLGDGDVVPGARMVLTVHDELVFEVPEDQTDLAASRVRQAMESAASLDVPLVVDVGFGKNWLEAH